MLYFFLGFVFPVPVRSSSAFLVIRQTDTEPTYMRDWDVRKTHYSTPLKTKQNKRKDFISLHDGTHLLFISFEALRFLFFNAISRFLLII